MAACGAGSLRNPRSLSADLNRPRQREASASRSRSASQAAETDTIKHGLKARAEPRLHTLLSHDVKSSRSLSDADPLQNNPNSLGSNEIRSIH